MSLYKVKAKIHVATGLSDFVSGGEETSSTNNTTKKETSTAAVSSTSEVEFIKLVVQPDTLKRRLKGQCGVENVTIKMESAAVTETGSSEDVGEERKNKRVRLNDDKDVTTTA